MTLTHSSDGETPSAGPRPRKPLLLLGAGDMAEVFAPSFDGHPDYEVAGCVVEDPSSPIGESLRDLPVIDIEDALKLSHTHAALSIIGSPSKARLVSRFEEAGFEFIHHFSALSDISPKAEIEPGVVISAYTLIDPFCRVGRHSIISVKVLLSHHCKVGAFSFVGPGATIAGNTTIGARCFVGAGAVLRDGITVGEGATVGAGAVVVKDVAPGVTVVGNPARPLGDSWQGLRPERRPLLIIGAGDMATTYADEFEDHPEYEIVAFVEDPAPGAAERTLLGRPVLGVEEALRLSATHAALCAIGSPRRQVLVERFERAGFAFATLISPTAIVHGPDGIEPGCVISDLANIDPDIRIGRHTLVTSRVTISHHAQVGAYSFVGPSVVLGGHARIGERCFIGMGALIRDHITIGDDVTVGAGAVVVRNIESGTTVAGVPARPIESKSRPSPGQGKTRQKVLLLGAGEQAASYAENVCDLPGIEIDGFVQDIDPERRERELGGRPVYTIDEVKDWNDTHKVVCCIGSMKKRQIIRKFEAMGFEFTTLVSSTALVSPKAELGPGCFVSHTGQIASFAKVGAHTMIGRQTMIGHHSSVGPYSLIAGSSVIGGGARIGEGCFIGMGALVRDHVTVGDGATVGVGAVVISDVPPGATVVGNPAHLLDNRGDIQGDSASPRRPLLLLGAGKMATNYSVLFGENPDYEVVGFVQDADPNRTGDRIREMPVYSLEEALKLKDTHSVISCIGSPKKREIIGRFEAAGFDFATLVMPTAKIHAETKLGPGCFVNHDSSIAPFAEVGAHTLIMRRVIIAHHATIGPGCTIAGGVIVAGSARIGSGCFIGLGALIRDGVSIGENVTVGAGAVVIEDVPSGTTVAGNPARPLEKSSRGSATKSPAFIKKARRPILILGAGGMGTGIAQTFRDDPDFEVVGFVQSSDPTNHDSEALGKPVYWIDDALAMRDEVAVISVIGSRGKRSFVQAFEKEGFEFINLIAPTAIIDPLANLGLGCVVTHFVSIEANTVVGSHNFFGRQSLLAHDSRFGSFGMVAPGAMIAGECQIGDGCFVGMRATLKDHLSVGDNATIGVGSVVIRDVPPGATVVGNPARILTPERHGD